MELIQPFTKDFILYIRKELNDSADLHFQSAVAGEVTVVYLSSIVNHREIEEHFLKPLEQIGIDRNLPELPGNWERFIAAISAKGRYQREDTEEVVADLLRGKTAIHLSGSNLVYTYDTRKEVKRQIKEPMFERTLRGPQLSFNESLDDNLSLVRQAIKSKELVKMKSISCGFLKNMRILPRLNFVRPIIVPMLIMFSRSGY